MQFSIAVSQNIPYEGLETKLENLVWIHVPNMGLIGDGFVQQLF
jgi:hypothetical protein